MMSITTYPEIDINMFSEDFHGKSLMEMYGVKIGIKKNNVCIETNNNRIKRDLECE